MTAGAGGGVGKGGPAFAADGIARECSYSGNHCLEFLQS